MEMDNRGLILLQEVAEKTAGRKLKWQESAQEGIFLTTLGGKYTVRSFPFEKMVDGERIGGPSLTLYEGSDMLLDVTASSPGVDLDQLKTLYHVIERQVRRIDEKEQSVQNAISLLKNL
jgi:hypothetical protein